jgi:predicted transcriptional regulator
MRNELDWTPEQIRPLRGLLDLNQTEFARLLGVDVRSVNRWENGKGRPCGSARGILSGLWEVIQGQTIEEADIRRLVIRNCVDMGGLACFVSKGLAALMEGQP